MLKFYGPIDFIRLGWRYFLARLKGSRMRSGARSAGVTVSDEPDINAEPFLERLKSLNIDAVVSVAASQIFRKKLLELPRLGCWNVHGGRLPRFRGMMPAFWTLMEGESEGAVTVHKMNSRLDDGDILLQRLYPIQDGEPLHDLIVRSKRIAAGALLDALETLHTGNYELQPNDRNQATIFTFPTKEEVQKFRRKGIRLI
jgi:methionyl-tRNA formyltransferase